MKVLVLEDNIPYSLEIKSMLTHFGYIDVTVINTYSEAEKYLNSYKPDLIISDVLMDNDQTVFGLFDDLDASQILVFMTAHNKEEQYERAQSYNLSGYLIKPFDKLSLKSIIDNTSRLNASAKPNEDFFNLKIKSKFLAIKKASIIYIRTEGNYCYIHTIDNEYMIRYTLNTLLEDLGYDMLFKIQRKYAINLNYLIEFDVPDSICKMDEVSLPVGRKYKADLKRVLKMNV